MNIVGDKIEKEDVSFA